MPLTIRNERISHEEKVAVSRAVERDLKEKAAITTSTASGSAGIQDAQQPSTVSDLVRQVPEVAHKVLPDNWVERMRKYIPTEVLVGWATTKQVLHVLFQGAVDTPMEITTFTVVWLVFVVAVAAWVFISLKRERLVVARDANLSLVDMVTHSAISALAFALYTMSMGPQFAVLSSRLEILNNPNILPTFVMFVFPMLVQSLGDTYIKTPSRVQEEAASKNE